ncbi:hypothetical protein [Klebsiella pneumoniae]|uniref:hypothetical protein n=1 Tax=Klebsiella pneumoniae TaxID=573 RepID=UPI00396F5745
MCADSGRRFQRLAHGQLLQRNRIAGVKARGVLAEETSCSSALIAGAAFAEVGI